jgi:uncharacterized protein (TIGR03382 family)
VPILESYLSYGGDGGSPQTGDVYEGRIVIQALGAACGASSPSVIPMVILPPETQLAIGPTNPIVCYLYQSGEAPEQLPASQCPTMASTGTFGLGFLPPTGAAWSLLPGQVLEIWFPLVSSAPLAGAPLLGSVAVLANVPQRLKAVVPVTILRAIAPTPASPISYAPVPITELTESSASANVVIDNGELAGDVFVDFGGSPMYGETTAPVGIGPSTSPLPLSVTLNGLSPGTVYHWRARFVAKSGVEYAGVDEMFVTLGAPASGSPTTPAPAADGGSAQVPQPQDSNGAAPKQAAGLKQGGSQGCSAAPAGGLFPMLLLAGLSTWLRRREAR